MLSLPPNTADAAADALLPSTSSFLCFFLSSFPPCLGELLREDAEDDELLELLELLELDELDELGEGLLFRLSFLDPPMLLLKLES